MLMHLHHCPMALHMTVAGRLSAFSIQRSATNELREADLVPGGDAVAQYHAELLQRDQRLNADR
jgi:hypothetical protein